MGCHQNIMIQCLERKPPTLTNKEQPTMSEAPAFFVPAATPDNQESVYADFAKWIGYPVPSPGKRIYSITYTHDGEEWIATVGERLRGTRLRTTRSRGKKIERTYPISDPAIVLAIFPGAPYMVVTNHRIAGNVGSAWENPFMAGQPTSIAYFSRGDTEDPA